jgi:hypothetical protein
MNIFTRIRNMFFGDRSTLDVLGVTPADSGVQANDIALWQRMLEGKAAWNDAANPSLRLASSICREDADYSLFELETSISGGSASAKYLDEQYQRVVDNLRNDVMSLLGFGNGVYKPYVKNGGIYARLVTINNYIPLQYSADGDLLSVMFFDKLKRNNKHYTLAEQHTWDAVKLSYTITYRAFESKLENVIGKEVGISTVPEWAALEPITFSNISQPLFVEVSLHDKQPIFAPAIKLIEQADLQFGRSLWEFEGGSMAIFADIDAFEKDKRSGAFSMPVNGDRTFRALDTNGGDVTNKIKEFAPTLRDQSIYNGLNQILRKIEFATGMAYGIISDPASVEKTAEEIRASKQRFFVTLQSLQKVIKKAMSNLVKSFVVIAELYGLAPYGEYDLIFNAGDGVLEDFDKEFNRRNLLYSEGLLKGVKVVSYAMGVSEEKAVDMMPETAAAFNE